MPDLLAMLDATFRPPVCRCAVCNSVLPPVHTPDHICDTCFAAALYDILGEFLGSHESEVDNASET